MVNKEQSFESIAAIWNNPPNCSSPIFPVLYFECLMARECRGFLRLENLIGDYDFVGYPLEGEDVIIDSMGRVFKLSFKDFIYPSSIITTFSVIELKQNVIPVLEYYTNEEFKKEIINETNVSDIVIKMVNCFAW